MQRKQKLITLSFQVWLARILWFRGCEIYYMMDDDLVNACIWRTSPKTAEIWDTLCKADFVLGGRMFSSGYDM